MQTTIQGVTKYHDSNGTLHYHSEKTFYMVPVIEREYMDGKGKNAVRMYECAGGRHFIADTYDKNFLVTKTAIRPKNYRDNNFNYTGGGPGSRK